MKIFRAILLPKIMRGDKNQLTCFYRALDYLISLPIDPCPDTPTNELILIIQDHYRSCARVSIEQRKDGRYIYVYRVLPTLNAIEVESINPDEFFWPVRKEILSITLHNGNRQHRWTK